MLSLLTYLIFSTHTWSVKQEGHNLTEKENTQVLRLLHSSVVMLVKSAVLWYCGYRDSPSLTSCIYLIKNTVKILRNFPTIKKKIHFNSLFFFKCNLFLLNSAVTLLCDRFQRSHNKEIIQLCWFGAQETFIVIINVKNRCAAYYVVETAHKILKKSIYINEIYN